MKMYYYSDGDNQFGPVTIEELKKNKISRETMVWFEGLDNWIKAGDVEDLKELFKSIPPPLITSNTIPPPINKPIEQNAFTTPSENPKKNKKWQLIIIIAGVLIIGLSAFFYLNNNPSDNNTNSDTTNSDSYNSLNNSDFESSNDQENNTSEAPPKQKTEEELRQELYDKEKKKPTDYLSVSYDLTYKVLSGKDQINGTIYNSATMVTFKDVVLTVSYSSATGTELYSEEFIIYKYVYPGASKSFEIKTYSPDGTKRIGVEIKDASYE